MITKPQTSWITLICFLLCFSSLKAQQNNVLTGTVFFKDGTNSIGQFDLIDLPENRVKFKQDENEKWQVLLPETIDSLHIGNNLFIRAFQLQSIEASEWLFLTRIFAADIQLYESKAADGNKVFFLRPSKNNELIRVNRANPNSQLKYIFKDCPEIQKTNIRNNRSNLLSAVEKAQACLNPQAEASIIKKLDTGSKLAFGLGLSTNIWDDPQVNGEQSLPFNNSVETTYEYGITVLFRYYLSERISFELGPQLAFRKLEGGAASIGRRQSSRDIYFMAPYNSSTYTSLKLPLTFQVHIPLAAGWEITPMIGGLIAPILSTQMESGFGRPEPGFPRFSEAFLDSWTMTAAELRSSGINRINAAALFELGISKSLSKNGLLELSSRLVLGDDNFNFYFYHQNERFNVPQYNNAFSSRITMPLLSLNLKYLYFLN